MLLPLTLLGLLLAGLAFAETPPFSHQRHAKSGVNCAACHPSPPPGVRMTTIRAAGCDSCHRERKPAVRPVRVTAWERVHQLPDEVRFSHKRHARQACALCHGKVEQRDLAEEEFPLNMAFCRECHIGSGAKSECGTCHPVK